MTRHNRQTFALDGGELIVNAALHAGPWVAGIVAQEAVIAAIVAPGITGASGYVGLTLPVGYPFYGLIESITLTSGAIHLYKPAA